MSRICENCPADISHLSPQRKFCSSRCQRAANGSRSVTVSKATHDLIRAEAERRGVSMPVVVEELLVVGLRGNA